MTEKINHRISIPAEYIKNLNHNLQVLEKEINSGNLPSYAKFVDKLFKEMETAVLSIHHCATGMSKESGELLSESSAMWVNNKPMKIHKFIEEMGDVYFYFQKLLNMMDLTLEDIQSVNYLKLLERYGGLEYSDKAAQEKVDQKKPGSDRKFFGQEQGD